MFDWIADRVFGPLLNALVAWSPWLWLIACVVIGVYLFFAMPLVFKRWWQALAALAVAGFVGLMLWQHFDGVADLERQNKELAEQNADLAEQNAGMNTTITDYTAALGRIEQGQRQIRSEIGRARQGLDSGTIQQETQDDPVQAATDLSDRWNRLGRMSDEATSSFGGATPSAAGPSADADPRR